MLVRLACLDIEENLYLNLGTHLRQVLSLEYQGRDISSEGRYGRLCHRAGRATSGGSGGRIGRQKQRTGSLLQRNRKSLSRPIIDGDGTRIQLQSKFQLSCPLTVDATAGL